MKLQLNENLFEDAPMTPKQRRQAVDTDFLSKIMKDIISKYSAVAKEYSYMDTRRSRRGDADTLLSSGWCIDRYSSNGVVVQLGLMGFGRTGEGQTVRRTIWKSYYDHTPEERASKFGFIDPKEHEDDDTYYDDTGRYYFDGDEIDNKSFKAMRQEMSQNISYAVNEVVPEATVTLELGQLLGKSVIANITIPYSVFS